ncbi:MAG: phosphoribosylamine--glycine ligase [Peptostreptococcales bacterium]
MKILVVGSGGREHAILWKLSQSKKISKLYCAPGNAGIASLAECIDIKAEDIQSLCGFAKLENIDLTVVGPEVPLTEGIVDVFEKEGLQVFGPNKKCAQLEGSKAFTKDFLIRHHIPTAQYKEYTSYEEARKDIGIYGYPMVIKADGLAAGKGVVIPENKKDAEVALKEMMADKVFGAAGDKVVIEEFLTGIESSILCFVDKNTIIPMVSAQDYKKIGDADKGPNTGGMGTYSPSLIYDDTLDKKIKEEILKPILEGFKKDGLDFRGILFVGLMVRDGEPKVLEFNVRFGDPETQTVITRLETDLVEIMESILEDRLKDQEIRWSSKETVCVVMASGGYPGDYEKGKVIEGLDKVDEDIIVFHGGTKLQGDKIVTNGGRVLGVTAFGKTLKEAREKAYKNVAKISFEGAQYRQDIGKIKGESNDGT